jgi:hypothetical protein
MDGFMEQIISHMIYNSPHVTLSDIKGWFNATIVVKTSICPSGVSIVRDISALSIVFPRCMTVKVTTNTVGALLVVLVLNLQDLVTLHHVEQEPLVYSVGTSYETWRLDSVLSY